MLPTYLNKSSCWQTAHRFCAPRPRQAAKTYLEKHHESFPTAPLDDLILHGLKALAGSLQASGQALLAAALECPRALGK